VDAGMTDTGAVHTVVSAGSRSAASGVSLTPRLIASDIAEMTLRSLAHTIALGGSDRSRNCVVASSASLWSPAARPWLLQRRPYLVTGTLLALFRLSDSMAGQQGRKSHQTISSRH
jgi:hypothetical protein